MQKQLTTIILTVVVTAIVVGGGVYLWQTGKTPSVGEQPKEQAEAPEVRTLTNEVSPAAPTAEPEGTEYVNSELGFSLQIPDGYLISQISAGMFQIVSKPTPENETPLPEMNLFIKSNEEVGNMEGWTKTASIVKEESVEINGVVGKKFVISDSTTGGQCPVYRLGNQGVVYEFSLYECLESNIFEDVVKSFRVISQ